MKTLKDVSTVCHCFSLLFISISAAYVFLTFVQKVPVATGTWKYFPLAALDV